MHRRGKRSVRNGGSLITEAGRCTWGCAVPDAVYDINSILDWHIPPSIVALHVDLGHNHLCGVASLVRRLEGCTATLRSLSLDLVGNNIDDVRALARLRDASSTRTLFTVRLNIANQRMWSSPRRRGEPVDAWLLGCVALEGVHLDVGGFPWSSTFLMSLAYLRGLRSLTLRLRNTTHVGGSDRRLGQCILGLPLLETLDLDVSDGNHQLQGLCGAVLRHPGVHTLSLNAASCRLDLGQMAFVRYVRCTSPPDAPFVPSGP